MMDPRGSRPAPRRWPRTRWPSSPPTCSTRPASSRDEVYEVALAGNATMTALVLGIDPEPLGVAPFVMSSGTLPTAARLRPRPGAAPAGPGGGLPGPRRVRRRRHRLRACWPPAWTATSAPGCSSTSAPTARSCSATATRSSPRPRPPARPSRAARSAAACGPPTAPSRWSGSTRTSRAACSLQVIGDVEPQWPVRLRPRRRGLRAGPGRAARRTPAGSSPTSGPREIAPHVADRLTAIGQERVFVLHRPDAGRARRGVGLPLPARRPRAAVRQGRHRHRLDAAARGARPRAVRRAAGAAGRLVRQLPLPRGRRPDRPGARRSRCCGSSRPATSPARARR